MPNESRKADAVDAAHARERGVPRPRRSPNTRLRGVLTQSRWTGQALATAVNAAGVEAGLTLTYDRTTVSHWLSGARPSARVADLVAEVFSRRLGRAVTKQDIGFGLPDDQPAVRPYSRSAEHDSVARLVRLTLADADPSQRTALRGLVYSVTALDAASRGRPSRYEPIQPAAAADGCERAQVIREMTAMFHEAGERFGGGQVRPALTAYLSLNVLHRLRTSGSSPAWRDLAAAVVELGYLLAFASYDCSLHGLAQRYYLACLGLADRAHAPELGAWVLRGMSLQAYFLGHGRESLKLALAASEHGCALHGTKAAALAGQLAVSYAVNGDPHEAHTHLRRAESLLEADDDNDGPFGAYHRSALSWQAAEVFAAEGNRRKAIEALTASIVRRPPNERRSRALSYARLAGLQLELGHLDAASASLRHIHDDYPYLQSTLVDAMLDDLRKRLQAFVYNSEAKEMLDRIAQLRSERFT